MRNKISIILSISALMFLTACIGNKTIEESKSVDKSMKIKYKVAVDGGVKYETKNNKYTSYHVNTQNVGKFNNGRVATTNEINAWNVDVLPDGSDMPEFDTKHGKPILDTNGNKIVAQGSVEFGNELYDAQCASCHGEFGTGGKGYPTLSGGDISSLKNQLMDPASKIKNLNPPEKRIGTFWPYASTLFWYIQDAMPFNHPKSLSNSETYAMTAYLLYENGVMINGKELDEDFVLSKANFKDIKMPNEDGFYPNVDTPEDPHQGVLNMKEYLSDPSNYGTGQRCMSDCIKGDIPVLHIDYELTDIQPKPSTKRDLPEISQNNSGNMAIKGKNSYEESCAVCHSSDVMGAPVLGDKEAWSTILEKDIEKIYSNSINGINGMPPRGGTSFDDAKMKEIIDYMIKTIK